MKNLKLLLLSISILFSSQVFAMEESQEDLDRKLLQAKVNAKDVDGKNALMIAVIRSPREVKYLINYCKSNNIKLNINAQDNYGWTALMIAAKHQPKAVKYLIKAGANVNIQNRFNKTALIIAIEYGEPEEIVKDLIQAGTDVNAKGRSDWTALMHVIFRQSKAVKHLIDCCLSNNVKLDTNVREKNYGNTALMMAVRSKPEKVKYLALLGADLNQIKDHPNAYQAASNIQNLVKILFALLKNYKNNRIQIVNITKSLSSQVPIRLIRDLNKNTLLHYAAINEDIQLFGFIYSVCPSLIAIENDKGITPFELILANSKVVESLKKIALEKDKPGAQPCNLF